MIIYSKIIALDLRNATIESVEKWFAKTDYITSNSTKNHIRHCITIWKDDIDSVQMLFIINNVVFGFINKMELPIIKIEDYFKKELLDYVTPIKLQEIESYRSIIIDWIFNSHKTKAKTAIELCAFQKYIVSNEIMMFPHFNDCVSAIDVEELGFSLKHLFVPINRKYKNILEEFRKYYKAVGYLNKIRLTRIFIIEKYILGYSFRMENEQNEHFFWNIHLEEQLLMIKPFTFDDIAKLTLDDVLDKINLVGIENLSDNDRNILESN